jgi:hypothetical protein
MREFSESDLAISIEVHAPDYRVDIGLLKLFLEFAKEFAQGLKVNISIPVLIND